ncbi:MAG: AMP-binding protein [Pseudomonadales bacterium]
MNILDLHDSVDRHLGRVLQLQAEQQGDADFLLAGNKRYSFDQVNTRVNRFANGLPGLGVRRGDRVVIYLHSDEEYIFLALAASKIGAIWVPVNTDYKGQWLLDAVNDSKAAMLVTAAELLPRLLEVEQDLNCKRVVVSGHDDKEFDASVLDLISLNELSEAPDHEPDMSAIHYGDTSAVLWTSGTTGKSKGVMQSHNAWLRSAESGNRAMQTQEGDIVYSCLPLYNSAAWTANIYRAMLVGIPCGLDPAFSVNHFWQRISFYQATQTLTLGAMHMFLWNAPAQANDADNTLRTAHMVPMPEDVIGPFCERFGMDSVIQGYGQSEALGITVRLNKPGKVWTANALGDPLSDLDIKLMDDKGNEVPTGEVGEFCLKPLRDYVIFNGYFDNPEATRNAYFGDRYRSGDLGRQDANGDYFFVDRKKDFIRYKGRNISSLQVESIAMRHPAVAEVAVYGLPSAELESESEMKMDVVLNPDHPLQAEELARFINDNAPYFFVPRYIEFVGALPYTPTNKVQKFKLRAEGLSKNAWDRVASGFELKR